LQAQNREVIFAGMHTGEALAEHYASGDVFLFPSTTETFGNVTVEALASGLAVVAYNYAAAAEFIRDGENGLLADIDNTRVFVDLAVRLACTPSRARALGQAARATAEKLDWATVYAAFETALREVISGQQPNRPADRLSA
jgi:glycosyltransferase involved in cell wall biosynthesis